MRALSKAQTGEILGIKRLLEEEDNIDGDDKYLRRNDPEKS